MPRNVTTSRTGITPSRNVLSLTRIAGAIRTVMDGAPVGDFEAPLVKDLNLRFGQGVATFTRASTASVTDFEGIIRQAKSGEARFDGARRVENLLTYSEDFSNAAWTKTRASVTPNVAIAPNGTLTADKVIMNGSVDPFVNRTIAVGALSNRTFTFNGWIWTDSGQPTDATLFMYDGTGVYIKFQAITLSTTPKRFSITYTFPAAASNTNITVRFDGTQIPSAGQYYYLYGAQLEEVTGQANQNPSEYVSTNVLTAAPYHGANVDSVKYFTTLNANTVTNNVVTEATGAAIPDATLKGYLAEGQRTNLVLRSEEFDNAAWVATAMTVTANTIASLTGALTADTLTATSANATLLQSITSASSDRAFSIYLKRKTGTGSISLTIDNGTAWNPVSITSNWARYDITQTTVTNPIVGIKISTSGDEVYAFGAQLE